ncbi:MAG: TatD family hydrolase [Treponema sp.]|jgi:TatD DNase family protein|nr:TatD family hydrolase [Treponema sp.]
MMCDAHCHPFNLLQKDGNFEEEACRPDLCYVSSAASLEEFEYNEALSRKRVSLGRLPPVSGYGVHPQFPRCSAASMQSYLDTLHSLAWEGRLGAVGECGFDLFDEAYRETEKIQDGLFIPHLELAVTKGLPLVLHVRRAMHKIFFHAKALKRCSAVIFHSWPGTQGEGEALLRRGINAFFSFGNTVALNHKEQIRCCAVFPLERILTETDAPYQALRGKQYSSWNDLTVILKAVADHRKTGVQELEANIYCNFRKAFGL